MAREAFLSSGHFASYQSVSDNMANALPLLSDSVQTGVFTLPVPQPLESQGQQVGTVWDVMGKLILPVQMRNVLSSPSGTDNVSMEKFCSVSRTPPSPCLGRPTD